MNSETRGKDDALIKKELKQVSEISNGIDISANVMKRIRAMDGHAKPVKPNPFRWSFALTLAGFFLIILISFTFFFFQEEYTGNPVKRNNTIKINSVEIDGKEAKKYYFNSENESRVVIWVQKYSEG